MSDIAGEIDDGEYATLRGASLEAVRYGGLLNRNICDMTDDTSEEGKLLECLRDDSVTYASTRDLEPPIPPPPPPPIPESECNLYAIDSVESQYVSSVQIEPVAVTVHHTVENHLTMQKAKIIRRGDSGMPHEVHLASPHSESTSTECSTSPPERAASDSSSSGIHSSEEREDVVIRPRQPKVMVKPPQPAIQEEPFGRSTNMRMSSFNADMNKACATLPANRTVTETRFDFNNHCNTMPYPMAASYQQQIQRAQPFITPNGSKSQLHTTLPNGVRYTNPILLRQIPLQMADSPYGTLGLGAGHHTFSKHLQDPLAFGGMSTSTGNYLMIGENDREQLLGSNHMKNV